MDLRRDQVALFRKFAHLYDSGVPLAEALHLARGELAGVLSEAVAQIVEDIYRGTNLADSMNRRSDLFAPEIIGVIRAGELRGELGSAARAAAEGLEGHVLDPAAVSAADVDAFLQRAGDGVAVHIEPSGAVYWRRGADLEESAEADAVGLAAGFVRRAGIVGGVGMGAFLWEDRLVRVSLAPTPTGLALVARVGGPPAAEPPGAEAWRKEKPSLLLVAGGRHTDRDAVLRGILRAFEPPRRRCVAVDLPVPEALSVPSVDVALTLDPDVVCVAHLWREDDGVQLVDAAESGIHAVAGVASARRFGELPHTLIRLGK